MKRPNLRDLHWVYPAWSAFLGALGGWAWKWLRRGILPVSGAVLAWAYGISVVRAVLYASSTAIIFSLPYSPDRHSYFVIFGVGALYGVTPWFLKFKKQWLWWPILTGTALVTLLLISAHVSWWTHKWSETVVFGLQGRLD